MWPIKRLTTRYTVDTASNRITAIDGTSSIVTLGFDANGSTIQDANGSYTYDAAGRLASLTSSYSMSVPASYIYDGLGRRVQKTVGSAITVHSYDEAGHLIGDYSGSGQPIIETVWLGNLPIAAIQASNTYYIHTDHLNTPRQIDNAAGQAVWTWDTTAFGSNLPNQDPNDTGSQFTYNLRFPGQYYDQESGLYYNLNRYYDATLGRYTGSDPIGLAGSSFSTYAYTGGNPISGIDPSGLNTLVIYGLPYSGNPFGHIGIAFTDEGIYSYGTPQPFGSSTTDYVLAQSQYRDQLLIDIPTTPEQEAAMMAAMNSYSGTPYSLASHNCATAVTGAEQAGGLVNDPLSPLAQLLPFLPQTAADIASLQPGATLTFLPVQGPFPSPLLNQFNPQ